MQPVVAIAVSGGVDSLVTAHLIKSAGYEAFCINFITGYASSSDILRHKKKIRQIEKQLKLPLYFVDLSESFRKEVIDYFISSYLSGFTPNPCMLCNTKIKFGKLLFHALNLGATHLATGHYARVEINGKKTPHLFKGKDTAKDQSYFLALLSPKQLSHALFPLGEWTKTSTREYAKRHGLEPVTTKESQDVCFIQDSNYIDFIQDQGVFLQDEGPIFDRDGRRIGTHKGIAAYTIGQRRGINCPGPEPLYVTNIDRDNNSITVGSKKDLLKKNFTVFEINWINRPDVKGERLLVQIRYRSSPEKAVLNIIDDRTASVLFEDSQTAITPGQAAVFYRKDEVIGGGWISK